MCSDWQSFPCCNSSRAVNNSGYASGYCPIEKRPKGAHVIACEKAYGPKPTKRHTVDHLCKNRRCVEPMHLRWATKRQQFNNSTPKATTRRSPELIKAIMRDYLVSRAGTTAIGKKYGIAHNTVWYYGTGGTHPELYAEVRRELGLDNCA